MRLPISFTRAFERQHLNTGKNSRFGTTTLIPFLVTLLVLHLAPLMVAILVQLVEPLLILLFGTYFDVNFDINFIAFETWPRFLFDINWFWFH